jgi:hypothetical protein
VKHWAAVLADRVAEVPGSVDYLCIARGWKELIRQVHEDRVKQPPQDFIALVVVRLKRRGLNFLLCRYQHVLGVPDRHGVEPELVLHKYLRGGLRIHGNAEPEVMGVLVEERPRRVVLQHLALEEINLG